MGQNATKHTNSCGGNPCVVGYYASDKQEVKTLADQKSSAACRQIAEESRVGVDPEQTDFCRNPHLPFVCYLSVISLPPPQV